MDDRKTLAEKMMSMSGRAALAFEAGMFWKPMLAEAVLAQLRQKDAITAPDILAQLDAWANDPNFEVEITQRQYKGEQARTFASDAITHLTKSLLK